MTKTSLVVLIAVFLLSFTHNTFAEIYKWVDEEGRVHFTDRPTNGVDSEPVTLSKINTYTSPELVETGVDLTDFKAGSESGKRVVMYSAEWCGVCKKARAYFKKKEILFGEYDVDKSSKGKRDFKKLGGKGVPVILVGKQRMNGFSAGKFEKIYGG